MTHIFISSFQTVAIGSSTIIACNIVLNTAIGPDLSVLNYYWYYNNKTTNQGPLLYVNNRKISSILEFSPFKASNAGVYQCSATIIGGNIITSIPTRLCVQGIIILIQ